jgi:uncharacterized membrane protein
MSAPPATALPAVATDPPGLRDAFGHLLRYGVVLSGVFLVLGILLAAARGSTGLAGSTGRLPLGQLAASLTAGDPWAYLFLGVAVLAATPVVRVALALGGFARVGDRAYMLITGLVLTVLLASLAIGAVG